jgi:peptidoglycan hydrolase-like protein with peptidoglycan-binding domain
MADLYDDRVEQGESIDVRRGSEGARVILLQQILRDVWGASDLDVDGVFGPLTEEAVRAFQRANPPLKVDGIVGPATTRVLNDDDAHEIGGGPPVKRGRPTDPVIVGGSLAGAAGLAVAIGGGVKGSKAALIVGSIVATTGFGAAAYRAWVTRTVRHATGQA